MYNLEELSSTARRDLFTRQKANSEDLREDSTDYECLDESDRDKNYGYARACVDGHTHQEREKKNVAARNVKFNQNNLQHLGSQNNSIGRVELSQ